jgi:iron complex outermembrane receptor protein
MTKPFFLPHSALLLVASSALLAQNQQPSAARPAQPAETLVVLGTATPVPLAESTRPVTILPVAAKSLAAESPQDLLRTDSSLFLEERGAGGGQADVVLRGGSFAQTLVLLNGFRINDSQTAHHNLDLPLPLEAMDSIQVLPGAGSTLHGVDALSGVVDFLTAAPDRNSLRLRAAEGSFQSNEESLVAGGVRGRMSGRLTASRNFSEGFMADRDYRNEDASGEGWAGTRLGLTDLMVATSDRSFGANQFYGNYNSWERTKSWFAAARQELGTHTIAAFGYRRHSDDFVLLRNLPLVYANNHVDGSWQSSLRRTVPVHANSLLLAGLEADGDSIRSYNFASGVTSYALGVHARNRGAGYVDLDLHPAARRWTLSAGAREEIFSGGRKAFSPQLSGSLRALAALKLRAAGGYGFRIPTYTDLYYSDPTTLGNPNLKPESAWNGEGGADWAPSARFTLSGTGFYTRQHNTIDYLRVNSTEPWQAANLSGLQFTGVEANLNWVPLRTETLRVNWTALHGAQSALHDLQSEYIFNYPVQNLHADWSAALPHRITVSNSLQLAERYQQRAYPVWNATVARDAGWVRPYLRLTNLTNTGYQEIVGVAMPGRAVMGGFALQLGK